MKLPKPKIKKDMTSGFSDVGANFGNKMTMAEAIGKPAVPKGTPSAVVPGGNPKPSIPKAPKAPRAPKASGAGVGMPAIKAEAELEKKGDLADHSHDLSPEMKAKGYSLKAGPAKDDFGNPLKGKMTATLHHNGQHVATSMFEDRHLNNAVQFHNKAAQQHAAKMGKSMKKGLCIPRKSKLSKEDLTGKTLGSSAPSVQLAVVGQKKAKPAHVGQTMVERVASQMKAPMAGLKAPGVGARAGLGLFEHIKSKRAGVQKAVDSDSKTMHKEEIGFDKLKNKLAHQKGVTNPAGLAAKIGRDKYGAKEMANKAKEGKMDKDEDMMMSEDTGKAAHTLSAKANASNKREDHLAAAAEHNAAASGHFHSAKQNPAKGDYHLNMGRMHTALKDYHESAMNKPKMDKDEDMMMAESKKFEMGDCVMCKKPEHMGKCMGKY